MAVTTDLAYELVKIGKLDQALLIYERSSACMKGEKGSSLHSVLQLRYAEALAASGDIQRRYAITNELDR